MNDLNFKDTATASMVLFAVIDIIGSIPLIIDIKQKAGYVSSEKATLVSMVIMYVFLFLGEEIIHLIGIDVNSFAVAGSFVLFFLALEMVLGINLFKQEINSPKVASVVPLAFPIIAGAGCMTSIISLRAEYAAINICVAIFINMIVVYVVLKLTNKIAHFLGLGGIAVLKKVFGVILLAIAVKLFSANVKVLFN